MDKQLPDKVLWEKETVLTSDCNKYRRIVMTGSAFNKQGFGRFLVFFTF